MMLQLVEFICRVVQFPEPDFLNLTGCETWNDALR